MEMFNNLEILATSQSIFNVVYAVCLLQYAQSATKCTGDKFSCTFYVLE